MERVISKSALDIDEQFHDSEVYSEEGEFVNGSREDNPEDNTDYNIKGDI